jgi:hypothetical protein
MFSTIMAKIFGSADAAQPSSQAAATAPGTAQLSSQATAAPTSGAAQPSTSPTAKPTAAPAQPTIQTVDVEAVLIQMASQKGVGGNWQTSIVDLLKLLDLDFSLDARKELADELNVQAGPHGSAEQNIALHKAVMRKLAESGGKVPDSLKD